MSESRLNLPEFYPSKLNPLLIRLVQSVSPLIAHWRHRMKLEIEQTDLDKLKRLAAHRLVLLPNHPTFYDWIAIFLLSTRAAEIFNYMAAYERFQGLEGKFLQQLGAYSIRRGLGDRPSVVYTIKLLMKPGCRLVIFPEGGCSFQNDIVMPFRTGAISMALQAINKLVKQSESVPNFYLVPVSIKYRYTSNMNQVIEDTLSRLEKALQVSKVSSELYPRLREVSDRVMMRMEKEYGLSNNEILRIDLE